MANTGCNYGVSKTENIAQEARKELSIMHSKVGFNPTALQHNFPLFTGLVSSWGKVLLCLLMSGMLSLLRYNLVFCVITSWQKHISNSTARIFCLKCIVDFTLECCIWLHSTLIIELSVHPRAQ